jgi:dihydroorotate dehydrogenase electron transfer subunit
MYPIKTTFPVNCVPEYDCPQRLSWFIARQKILCYYPMMHSHTGTVQEMLLDQRGRTAVRVSCPVQAIPSPGRYVLAHALSEVDAALSFPLFPSHISLDGFTSTPGASASWEPGTILSLRKLAGHGFTIPASSQHLLLAALGDGIERLLPLINLALENRRGVALFTDVWTPSLPAAVEVRPLSDLPGAIEWADALCCELPLEQLAVLRQVLGLDSEDRLIFHAEALIETPMPCGGIADCGVCAVKGTRKWKYSCRDGPVFDLNELDW